MRDKLGDLDALGAVVVGVSQDSVEAQCAFADKLGLSYFLAADTDGALGKIFGVGSVGGMYQRITVVVDPQGAVAARIENVTPRNHAEQVIEAIRGKQAQAPSSPAPPAAPAKAP